MPFRAVTYNVLATAYIRPERYPGVEPELLDPERRIPSLVQYIESLAAELLCLQEVEDETFVALDERLRPLGYEGHYELKGHNRPEGCATFYRTGSFTLRSVQRLDFHDRARPENSDSGHIASLLGLEYRGHVLGVVNTHLRWDKPGTAPTTQIGFRQITELLDCCQRFTPHCRGWLICGDFNCTIDSAIVAAVRQADYEPAHANRPQARSCVANGRARLIDYLFYSGLQARPIDPVPITDDTPLPSAEQPSDHLALAAEFEWVP